MVDDGAEHRELLGRGAAVDVDSGDQGTDERLDEARGEGQRHVQSLGTTPTRRAHYRVDVDVLDRMIDEAASELQAATGGAALCRITASGAPGRSAKRAEGRWAALQSLSSALVTDPSDPRATAAALLEQWESDLTRWRAHPQSSWVPYCEGGVEGLREFVASC